MRDKAVGGTTEGARSGPRFGTLNALRDLHARGRASLFWALLNRQRRWLKWLVGLFVTSVIVQLLISGLTRNMVDQGIVDQSRPLGPFVSRIAVMGLFGLVASFASAQITQRVSYQLEFDMRTWLYTRIQSAELTRLNGVATGQLVTRALTDLQLLERLLSVVPFAIGLFPVLIGLELVLFFLSWEMALLTPLAIPVNLWLLRRFRTRLWGLSWAELNERAEVAGAIDEPVRGIRVVKAFGQEDQARARVGAVALRAYQYSITRIRLLARYDFIMKLVPYVVQAVVVAIGARLFAAGRLSTGAFLLAFQFVASVTAFATVFDQLADSWQYLRSAQGRLTEVLALGSLPAADGRPLRAPSTGLELRHVTVRAGGRTVLDDITLHGAPGELVVISGPPGSGKSTLAAVAAAIVRPETGAVMLDGLPLDEADPLALRRAFHVVSEDSVLFATTLRENLELGAGGCAEEEALAGALWAAAAEDVVADLPHGLDSDIGDRGLTLSGGQRQRLALARAVVAPPRVLVLDDAMAAVNPSLEVEILRRVRSHSPGMTIVCITRRPGPTALADHLVVLPPPVAPTRADADADADADVDAEDDVDTPPPSDIAEIVRSLRLSEERPSVTESQASDDRPPTFRSVARPFVPLLLAGVLVLLIQSLSQLSPQYLFGQIADVAERGASAADVRALAMLGIAVVYAWSSYLFRVIVQRFAEGAIYLLRRRVFARLSRLGVDFYDRELPGQVAVRVVNDLDTLLDFLRQDAFLFVTAVGQFIVGMVVLGLIDPTVVPLAMLLSVFIVAITLVQLPIGMRAFTWARDALGRVTAKFQEDLNARTEIRNLGAERVQTRKFVEASWDRRSARLYSATVANAYAAIMQYAALITATLVLWRAGGSVLSGAISIGTALTLRLLATTATQPLQTMGQAYNQFLKARVSWQRLHEPFEVPVLPESTPDARPCPSLRGELAFDGVDFAYPHTGRTVLNQVSFRVEPDTITAIVGYTGAGKSSIAKLLTRVYDPTSGAVTAGGTDIRNFDLDSYRCRIGVVPQDAFVFKGTVGSNISYGRPDATHGEILDAVHGVGAGHLLDGHPGLDQHVAEEGRNLTAAQRQLIALARAWLVRPDVLVLDEATSSLDEEVESRVLDALARLGITIVTITHRENVAARSDFLVVLEGGRVVESGPRSEVAAEGGVFARLWVSPDDELVAVATSPSGGKRRRRESALTAGTAATAAARGASVPDGSTGAHADAADPNSHRNGRARL